MADWTKRVPRKHYGVGSNPRISFFIRLIYSLFNFTHVTNHYFPRIELHLIKFNSYDSLSKMWSYFSSIHPFTALKLFVWFFFSGQLWDGFVTPNSCIKIQLPLPTPWFNVALNSGVRACTMWINIVATLWRHTEHIFMAQHCMGEGGGRGSIFP